MEPIDGDNTPVLTLTMHQLAKIIALVISDYCIVADQPFDRGVARKIMETGLRTTVYRQSMSAGDLPLIVLPRTRGEL